MTAGSSRLDVLTAAYTAFGAGDMAALGALLAKDTVWQIADVAPLDGEYRGPEAVYGFLGALMAQTDGTVAIAPIALMGSDTHASAFIRETATRQSRELTATAVHLIEVINGKITQFSASTSDPANTAFWTP